MKRLIKIVTVTLLTLWCINLDAQTKEQPWYIGLGYNVVDFYPNGEGGAPKYNVDPFSEVIFGGFFNTNHYNIAPASLKLTIGRYLGENFSVELSGSYNEITNWGSIPVAELRNYPSYQPAYNSVEALDYYGGSLEVNYSFRNYLDPEGWAEPFIGIGGGVTVVEVWNVKEDTSTSIKTENDFLGTGNINFTVGLGIRLSDRFSLVYETSYKYLPYDHTVKNFTDSHFQHSLSLMYHFNFVFRTKPCYTF